MTAATFVVEGLQKDKMADDWQLEAVHEQFNVFDQLTTPYEKISSTDFQRVMTKIRSINKVHLKMNEAICPRRISAEIMKHPDGDEIKLSFVLIITNIEYNGSLCKMPIFVIMSGGKRIFIDMNLTLFNCWEMFLKNNSLPPCQYCFPFGGQYNVGGKLKIDFASSPAAIRKNVNFMWKGLGFVVAVGVVVGSYFFTIPPIKHSQADSLLSIADDFIPGIKEYFSSVLRVVTLVQKLKSGELDIVQALPELWKMLKRLNDEFSEHISLAYEKVRSALWKLFDWIRKLLPSFFGNASESAQHNFVAVTSRVDTKIIEIDSEAEELLEASRKKNRQVLPIVDAMGIHDQVDTEKSAGYANTIFRNAKVESALQDGMKPKESQNLHSVTSDLLRISNSVAQNLGKTNLKEAQDIFEALSDIVQDEYKNKIQTYSKMLEAARAGAGHPIDQEAFNLSLGIEGDPKKYYWQEAVSSTVKTHLAYHLLDKIVNLEKQKKILILELGKETEDGVAGVYRCVGVDGAGKFTANDLIKALKEIKVDLNEDKLVINETSSMILVRTEDLIIGAMQELNSENTSEGMVLIERMEV